MKFSLKILFLKKMQSVQIITLSDYFKSQVLK